MNRLFCILCLLIGLLVMNLGLDRLAFVSSTDKSASWKKVLSDWFWLQGYGAWIDKDEQRLLDNYRFATALQPNHLTYWRLAAQTIAYDLPLWKGDPSSEELRMEYGRKALDFFETSRPFFETDPDWFVAAGFLAETAVGDQDLSVAYLAEAVSFRGFPYRAGRTFARLLMDTGQGEKALAFLKNWIPQLKEQAIEPRVSEIEAWIRLLEKQLNLPH